MLINFSMENAPLYVVSLYIMIFKNLSVELKDASVSSKFSEIFGAFQKFRVGCPLH
jgi:hypothetical protein